MPGRNVEWDDERIRRNMQRSPGRIDAALTTIINRHAVMGEAWMKSHARWTDRTGNARQGLHGVAEREKHNYYMVVLAHAVSYGIWLEVAHNGRYEIINPAMRHTGDQVMISVSGIFARLFGGGE